MQMVGILAACYLLTLIALCVFRKVINIRVANAIFMIVDALFFMGWTYASFVNGWSESGFLSFDNISPFIMTIIPLTGFLNKKAREYTDSAIAFLWLGMFVALIVSPGHSYINGNNDAASFGFATEAASHLVASLYGIFLIISGQVKCNAKNLKKAALFMYAVIGIGVGANYLFRFDNFGMNPYGDYSIYMIDIFNSFEATLIAYLLGVFAVLTFGMQFGRLIAMTAKKPVNAEISHEEYEIQSEMNKETEGEEDQADKSPLPEAEEEI